MSCSGRRELSAMYGLVDKPTVVVVVEMAVAVVAVICDEKLW